MSVKSFFVIKPRRQLREMYFFLFLFSLAAALITVFEPIFFYTQGIPIWKISLYYALHYVLYILLMPLGGMFSARFGYERSLVLSAPLFVLYFLLLASLASYQPIFWLALVVLTIFKVFYWPAYHANFAAYSDRTNRGTEQSWVGLLEYGAGAVGPVLGGVVAQQYGFPVLFLATAGMVALAGIVLLRTRERSHLSAFNYLSAWRIILAPRHRHMVVSMLGWGENLVYLALWPVFLLLVLGEVKIVGAVASVSALLATIAGFVIGELSDRLAAKPVLRLAVPYMVFGYIWRLFAVMPWQAALGDALTRTGAVGVAIPFLSRLYRQAKRVGTLEYVVAFEIVLAIGKAVTAILLVLLFLTLPQPAAFVLAFGLAGLIALLYRFF